MSQSTPKPALFKVISSQRVAAEIRTLYEHAKAAGFGPQMIKALKEMNHVLSLYPQFGEPLHDLTTVGETVCIATFGPLYVKYIIDEPHRSVFIVAPLRAMPHVGFQ